MIHCVWWVYQCKWTSKYPQGYFLKAYLQQGIEGNKEKIRKKRTVMIFKMPPVCLTGGILGLVTIMVVF